MTTVTTTYRCISPMIQLTVPRAAGSAAAIDETTFRNGDSLPTWMDPGDAARLLVDGFIEEVKA